MIKYNQKSEKVAGGGPGGFEISLMMHVAVFMLAGMFVVFNVVNKEEKKFVLPEAVERPGMKLTKPKVKKNAKPKASSRIVINVKRSDMPDLQLPEMSGMGEGIAGGLGGGFDIMPDLGEVMLFGGGMAAGNDFVGTFYDFKTRPKRHYQSARANCFLEKRNGSC